jgi:hypothetical protein
VEVLAATVFLVGDAMNVNVNVVHVADFDDDNCYYWMMQTFDDYYKNWLMLFFLRWYYNEYYQSR